jgi:hypothetical protein
VPDQVAYYASQDYGIDPNRTLELQDLVGTDNNNICLPKMWNDVCTL